MAAVPEQHKEFEQRIIMHGVQWETYERLLADLADHSVPRLTFDQGTLEIMSPTPEHEEYNRTLALLVEITAEETDVDIRRLGSTTFKRADLLKGFEPDSCFYIQSAGLIKGIKRIDLTRDPPPDLVIEIDITSPSLNRFAIFAQVGIPEIWRYDGETAQIFNLADANYQETECSMALPPLTRAVLSELVEASATLTSTQWLRRVRQWLREQ